MSGPLTSALKSTSGGRGNGSGLPYDIVEGHARHNGDQTLRIDLKNLNKSKEDQHVKLVTPLEFSDLAGGLLCLCWRYNMG